MTNYAINFTAFFKVRCKFIFSNQLFFEVVNRCNGTSHK